MFDASRVLEPAFQEQPASFFWQSILANYAVDEDTYLKSLIPIAQSDAAESKAVTEVATDLIQKVREQDDSVHMIDALLHEYSLNTQEGILLMCLTEALMRIPDKYTADALIRDKVSDADWKKHVGHSESTLVNASTWGLLLTGRIVKLDNQLDDSPSSIWKRLIKRSGEPVIRRAMRQAMDIMSGQFVLGRDIDDALSNAVNFIRRGYTYSFDMLGEAAITRDDASRYFNKYRNAVAAVGKTGTKYQKSLPASVSVKLSALHPRFEKSQEERVLAELFETVSELVGFARDQGVSITLDAEEMDRLELSLKLFEKVFRAPVAAGWGEFGLAIQAYSKRALPVLCWLNRLAKEQGDEIPLRLVKGAYWDNEIKHCQQMGIADYPVFTRKEGTDTSYLACLRFLLSDYTKGGLYPQIASHNAHTIASVLAMLRKKSRRIEFQRLHGMGDALYSSIMAVHDVPVRIYAPVGAHKELLPYLIRRLLENGANSSFVHRLVDAATPVDSLVQDPVQELQKYDTLANDRIPSPPFIFGEERVKARGRNLRVAAHLDPLLEGLGKWRDYRWRAGPIIRGKSHFSGAPTPISSPGNSSQLVGDVHGCDAAQADTALTAAVEGFDRWSEYPVADRVSCLLRFSDLLEKNAEELIALCSKEAGKTLQDSVDEVREAVDLCRYYAVQGRARFGHAMAMSGITGESAELYMEGRGVFLCISPRSCPLAIFTGQVMAALVAGNTVVATPAKQASLVSHRAAQLMLDAGFPLDVIQLLPGDGESIFSILIPDPRIAGVAFTGSTNEAFEINRALSERRGAIIPFIAETGSHNAMIVDSSALPEQVVRDVVKSAFVSAGQRCSSLQALYLQADVADKIETLLAGAMAELTVGDPENYCTDIGPVNSPAIKVAFERQSKALKQSARLIGRAPPVDWSQSGCFVSPSAWEVESYQYLKNDDFGPILRVIRYKAGNLDAVIDEINAAESWLTLCIHSRGQSTLAHVERKVKASNTYVNRDQAGSAVGVQPFGSPNYLLRFATERTRTVNTTAIGGNASLLCLGIEKV